MTARSPEPRRCSVCDQRETTGEAFNAHEDACFQSQRAKQAAADADRARPASEAATGEMAAVGAHDGR